MPNLTINAVIDGNNIVKAGTGVLRLSGSNGFTGAFDLQAGGVLLGHNNALSTAALTLGNDTFFSSSADDRVILNDFTMNGNFGLRDAFNLTMNGAGTLTAGLHNIEVQFASKNLTFGGTLSGAGGINKIGDGILLLNSSNVYDGVTTVTDGTLIYGAVGAVPTGSALTVQEGALVDITLGGSAVTVGSIASNSATQGGVIVTTETSGTTVFTVGGDNTSTSFGGTMVATSGATLEFVKTGTGTLTLGGINLYTGKTTVEDGRLVVKTVAGGSALGASQSLAFGSATTNSSGILQLGDAAAPLDKTFTAVSSEGTGTANAIVSGNAGMSTLTFDFADTSTFAGNIGLGGTNEGNLNLVKNGAGDLVISGTGTSTYSGTTVVNAGKLFFDTVGGFSSTTTSLTVADGTEFTLRGHTGNTVTSYGFSGGAGAKIVVGSSSGATLGFGIDGAVGVNQFVLAAGQTLQLTGTLTTAIYVNGAPTDGNQYVLIDGVDAGSLSAFSGTGAFNLNPVVFNGGSFTYGLALTSGVHGGGAEQWTLTATAVPSAADPWWTSDLDGLAQGVWSATLTTGTGFPSNWATDNTGGTDALVPPDGQSNVHFSAAGADNFDTTLGADMTIKSLTFHSGNAATTIGSSNGINTLTLGNGTDPTALTFEAGAEDVGISAIVNLPQDQSWNIEDTVRMLTLSGGLTGTARTLSVNDLVTNAGSLVFSGSAASMTGTLVINEGNLVFDDTGSLNSGLDVVLGNASTSATLRLGGTSAASGAVIGGLSNGTFAGSSVIGGNGTASTLIIGAASGSHTFTGSLGGGGTNENNFNLVKAGAGTQILDGSITYAGTTIVTEGILQLGSNSSFAPGGLLSVIANAGATATFDFNGKNYTTLGDLVLGGGTDGISQVLDTNGTKGTVTLGGNIVYDPTNDPGGAVISVNLGSGSANRTITVDDSANTTNELTLNGNFTGATNNNLTINGSGNGTINGNISILNGTGTTKDVNFSSTGVWTINGKIEVTDNIGINTGVVNATAGESLDATNDVVVDGTGTPGSAIVNISSTSQVHTGDAFFIQNGGLVNVTGNNGIGTGTAILYVGNSASSTTASAAVLNLDLAGSDAIRPGQILVGNGSSIGYVTGTGTITTTSNKILRNGTIGENITLAGDGVMLRDGSGSLTFYGARDVASTGDTLIREGELILDYSLNNASKIGDVLQLGYTSAQRNPILIMNGSSSASITETMLRTIILPGNTTVGINNGTGQTATLALQAITRSVVGGTVDFEYSSTDAKVTSTSPAGTLGWATVKTGLGGIASIAAINGSGDIVAATLTTQNDVSVWASGQNIVNDAALTGIIDCTHIESLTFAAAEASALTISASGNLAIESGGILVSESVGAFDTVITGGSLHGTTSGTSGEIIVHQNNTSGLLTISSNIVNSAGVTKSGDGTLVLTGSNTYSSGSEININQGILRLSGGNVIADNGLVRLKLGATLDLNDSTETIGSITDESNGTLALGTSGSLKINQALTTDYRGLFTGGAASSLTINAVDSNGTTTYEFRVYGATTTGFTGSVNVDGGMLRLYQGGRMDNAAGFVVNNASLLFDNTSGTRSGVRVSNSATITLNSANGTFSNATQVRGLASHGSELHIKRQ
ncbi:MAG: autotransporter-associated beta strand repeat-containing protein [Prosthecobacter sp.]